MAVLKVSKLSKRFGKKIIVTDINFAVASGTIASILGPNGAGKTTIFSSIIGLSSIDTGTISLDELNLNKLSVDERAKAGITYLPQEPSIFRGLTVFENIFAICELRPELSTAEKHQKTAELIEEFRLGHIQNSLGNSLSGGERRRTEIARALAIDPKFILLDEPFAAIDPLSISDTKNIIAKLKNKNIGVLITDHNVRETLSISDVGYIVNNGKIICHGSQEEILSNEEVKKSYLGEQFTV